MPVEEPDIGIDKQKVVREIVKVDTSLSSDASDQGGGDEEKEKGPSFWKIVWENSDQIGSLMTLLAGVVWIIAGFVLAHPIPMAVGGVLLIPGTLGLAGFFKKAAG